MLKNKFLLNTATVFIIMLGLLFVFHILMQLKNPQGGIGCAFSYKKINEQTSLICIDKVKKGFPADEAGIEPNDCFSKIDEQSTVNMCLQKVAKLIKGKAGTIVSIDLIRNNKVLKFKIKRRKLELNLNPFMIL